MQNEEHRQGVDRQKYRQSNTPPTKMQQRAARGEPQHRSSSGAPTPNSYSSVQQTGSHEKPAWSTLTKKYATPAAIGARERTLGYGGRSEPRSRESGGMV